MRKTWVFLGLLIAFLVWGGLNGVVLAQAEQDVATFERANQLYENGSFAEAAQVYQLLIDSGVSDAALFYNAGNAYYRSGDMGRAILNYERARLLRPRDEDVRLNLTLAQAQATDRYEPRQAVWWVQLTAWSNRWLTVTELAWLALVGWLLLAAGGVVWWLVGRERGGNGRLWPIFFTVVTIFCVGCGLLWAGRAYQVEARPTAVVVVESVPVVSGPGQQYATEFVLHSGAQVGILEQRRDWVRLALPGNQLQGWVMASAIEAIYLVEAS